MRKGKIFTLNATLPDRPQVVTRKICTLQKGQALSMTASLPDRPQDFIIRAILGDSAIYDLKKYPIYTGKLGAFLKCRNTWSFSKSF